MDEKPRLLSSGDPVRVLRVIARMNVGGPARQVVALHHPDTGLGAFGFEQRLLTGTVGPDEADELQLRGADVEVTVVPGLGRAVRFTGDGRALAAISAEIRRFRPHIVHTHTAKAGVLGRVSAWAMAPSAATVHTFHGHLLRGYFAPRIRAAVCATERLLAKRTTRLVAVGQRVRDELVAAGIGQREQYAIVPPGVDLPAAPAQTEARRVLGVEERGAGLVVGFAGRLTDVKRPDRLLDAVATLRARDFRTTVLVAGEGALEAEMRDTAARLGVEDSVRFLGMRADMEVFWAACDVGLVTSDNEGMPMALIEAALLGRPAVTTDVGSASEVVLDGRTGFVVAPTPAAIADGVARLRDPELRERMGQAAREHAAAHFSAERLVRDTSAIYRQLAES